MSTFYPSVVTAEPLTGAIVDGATTVAFPPSRKYMVCSLDYSAGVPTVLPEETTASYTVYLGFIQDGSTQVLYNWSIAFPLDSVPDASKVYAESTKGVKSFVTLDSNAANNIAYYTNSTNTILTFWCSIKNHSSGTYVTVGAGPMTGEYPVFSFIIPQTQSQTSGSGLSVFADISANSVLSNPPLVTMKTYMMSATAKMYTGIGIGLILVGVILVAAGSFVVYYKKTSSSKKKKPEQKVIFY